MTTRRVLLPAPYDVWGPVPPHSSERPRHRWWRRIERVLLLIAIISLIMLGELLNRWIRGTFQ